MQVYKHGFLTEEADVLPCVNPPPLTPSSTSSPAPSAPTLPTRLTARPMCFILDKNTPPDLMSVAIGARSASQGHIVYQVDEGDYRLIRGDNPGSGSSAEVLVYEPHIAASVFTFPDEDIKVLVRQNQRVNPDGTVGFVFDDVVVRPRIERTTGSAMKHASVTAAAVLGQPDIVLEGDVSIKSALKLLQGRRYALPFTRFYLEQVLTYCFVWL